MADFHESVFFALRAELVSSFNAAHKTLHRMKMDAIAALDGAAASVFARLEVVAAPDAQPDLVQAIAKPSIILVQDLCGIVNAFLGKICCDGDVVLSKVEEAASCVQIAPGFQGEQLSIVFNTDTPIGHIAISVDSTFIAVSQRDGTKVGVLKLPQFDFVSAFDKPSVKGMCFSPCGNIIVSGETYIEELTFTGAPLRCLVEKDAAETDGNPVLSPGNHAVDSSADVIVCSTNSCVLVFDYHDCASTRKIGGECCDRRGLRLSRGGQKVAVCENTSVVLYDIYSAHCLRVFRFDAVLLYPYMPLDVCFTEAGEIVIAGCEAKPAPLFGNVGTLVAVSTRTGNVATQTVLPGYFTPSRSIAFRKNCVYIAVDNKVHVFT